MSRAYNSRYGFRDAVDRCGTPEQSIATIDSDLVGLCYWLRKKQHPPFPEVHPNTTGFYSARETLTPTMRFVYISLIKAEIDSGHAQGIDRDRLRDAVDEYILLYEQYGASLEFVRGSRLISGMEVVEANEFERLLKNTARSFTGVPSTLLTRDYGIFSINGIDGMEWRGTVGQLRYCIRGATNATTTLQIIEKLKGKISGVDFDALKDELNKHSKPTPTKLGKVPSNDVAVNFLRRFFAG